MWVKVVGAEHWEVAAMPDIKFVSVDEVPADMMEKALGSTNYALIVANSY